MSCTRILTVGAGAVGSYFTGRLAALKEVEASLTVRSDYETIRQNGVGVESSFGDFHFRPSGVYRAAAEYPGVADYIILTSKVLPEIDRAALLRDAVRSPKTVIVLIQNGIDIEHEVAEAFPQNELLSTIAYIGATRVAPGKVMQKGAARLVFGRYGGGRSEAGEHLEKLFATAGVQARCVEDIAFFRWEKLTWNLPYNPLSVLGGGLLTNEMCDRGPVETLCCDLMREVIDLAAACGSVLPEDIVARQLEFTRNFPPYKTSMLVDYEAGRPLEVEAILGNACRLAETRNVAVPRMKACYALLRALDAKRRAVKCSMA